MDTQTAERQTRSNVVSSSVIPAGGTFGISQYAERFYFRTCTAEVFAKTDHTAERPYIKGQGENFTTEMRFNRLEIRNPNAFDVFVQVWVGFGEFLDSTAEIVEGYSRIYGGSATTLAASGTIVLNGSPSGVQIQRRSFVISNLDVASRLEVLDSNGNHCASCFPLQSITLPVSGPVTIKNETSSTIALRYSEIWYTYQ